MEILLRLPQVTQDEDLLALHAHYSDAYMYISEIGAIKALGKDMMAIEFNKEY